MATAAKKPAAPAAPVKAVAAKKAPPKKAPVTAAAKKVAVKKAAVKAIAVKPVAAKKMTSSEVKLKASTAAKPVLTSEQRAHYVSVAAFYIAERRGFTLGNPQADWLAAEAEIDRLIASGHFTV